MQLIKKVEDLFEELRIGFQQPNLRIHIIMDTFKNYSLKFSDFNKSENRNLIREHNQNIMREKCLKRFAPSIPSGAIRIGH